MLKISFLISVITINFSFTRTSGLGPLFADIVKIAKEGSVVP